MLRSLQIRNYVLIDSLETEFPEGLVIITGQTGAGKSILLGALSLVLGARADASVIAHGGDNCVVEAEFSIADPSGSVASLLDEHGVEYDGSCIIVRRVVASSGRSRCFVNDCPVPASLLQSLSGYLVDIHSQHQSLSLADKRFQMSVLDLYAANAGLLEQCRSAWKTVQSLEKSLAESRERLEELRREKDYNSARFEMLDKAAIREGELEELEQMQRKLANAEQIHECLSSVRSLIGDGPEEESLSAAMKDASRLLTRCSRFVPELGPLQERLESARIEVEDILSEIVSIDEDVPRSGDKLAEVEARMSLLYELFTKFGCRTEGELVERREFYARALFDSTALEEETERLQAALDSARKGHEALCAQLAASRRKAAPLFSSSISDSIHYLELDNARFSVELTASAPGPDGSDAIRFLFSSNPSVAPADVAKCASGGELSRIMLCLKAMMARYTGMPTLIFDEIDTGVSGSAASKMGSMICSMGNDMQVFAITHLPQVASRGKAHFLVSKDSGHSTVRLLGKDERVMEIARLLSGESITSEAVANAKALLSEGS